MERKENETWHPALGPLPLMILIGAVAMLFLQTRQLLPEFSIVAFSLIAGFGMIGFGFGLARSGHNDGVTKISSIFIPRRATPSSEADVTTTKSALVGEDCYGIVPVEDSYWLHDNSPGLGEKSYTALGETRRNIYSFVPPTQDVGIE